MTKGKVEGDGPGEESRKVPPGVGLGEFSLVGLLFQTRPSCL